ncbi:MAG: TlpA family protein disulfide reductase [Neisseria sp.]|jgi:thiol-disulfide isomerase/thioredoxin|uniref:TlpA disulfide reductase family protein n=1 Tax=Uruburuella suis TaxID=252130 RepID=UPI001B5C14B5|nr:TlpA family protein disulfide reductase [Neisseria sp.]MBP8025118.1 TlpA family protein disulfide reductase [Neisseria sp.]MBP8043311.1 TlpA family protein disulfide reductase [Neisseria sp.]MBP8045925.1 TlpA family protein disulfide reductase [Neisseria sp.]MBP8070424.1 TlpA family protein disulfide reductase [Neisseria sp.]
MKKITVFLTAALLAAGAQTMAADLQDWQSNAPKNVNALKAPVRVVNLWATWCGPCRKEMPEMSAWYQKQKKGSVDMVGIALDSSENIGRFLKTTPVRYPIWRYSGNDSRAWMKSFGNSIGGLPFTVVEAPKCGYRQTLLGEVTAKKLDAALAAARAKCAA